MLRLGSVPQVEAGSLVIFVGGEQETYQACKPILDVLGTSSFYMGPSGMGTTMKLVVNTLLGPNMQAMAEALILGEKSGLERAQLIEVLKQTAVISPRQKAALENAAQRDIRRELSPATDVQGFWPYSAPGVRAGCSHASDGTAQQVYAIAEAKGIEDDVAAIIRPTEELVLLC